MKIVDTFIKLLLLCVLSWIGWSLHQLTALDWPRFMEVSVVSPVAIEASEDLSVRGQMIIDIDRMPFDTGEPIPVKIDAAPTLDVQLDRWTLQNLR
jgi:hypothetical protein